MKTKKSYYNIVVALFLLIAVRALFSKPPKLY